MERLTNEPMPESKPILEINAGHPLVERLVTLDTRKELSGGDIDVVQELEDLAYMLFYEAMMAEGEHFEVPNDFGDRLNRLLAKVS
jgi:molecular chaperone HtpG